MKQWKHTIKWILCAVLLVAALLAQGCSRGTQAAAATEVPEVSPTPVPLYTPPDADEPGIRDVNGVKVGLALYTNDEENTQYALGFTRICELSGVAGNVTYAGGSTEQQAADIRAFAQQGYTAVAVGPASGDEAVVERACARVMQAGVQVVSIGGLESDVAAVSVQPWIYASAYQLADELARVHNKQGRAAILGIQGGGWRMRQRAEEFRAYIALIGQDAELGKEFTLIKEAQAETYDDAVDVATEWMQEYPGVQIWCTHPLALSAAVEAAQQVAPDTIIGGFDLGTNTLELLRQGSVYAISALYPPIQGEAAAEAAIALSLGQVYPSIVYTNSKYYTWEEADIAAVEIWGNIEE